MTAVEEQGQGEQTSPRWTAYMPIRDLLPALKNPKRHDLPYLRASLGRFGFIENIILDERTGRLLAGHGRVELCGLLEDLGAAPDDWTAGQSWPPEGVVVRPGDGAWMLPVDRGVRSRDDDEAHAMGITLNRGAERGGWDQRELARTLEGFASLDGLGYDRADLDDLLKSSRDPEPPPEFPRVDDDVAIEHLCPRCGYEWSGRAKGQRLPTDPDA